MKSYRDFRIYYPAVLLLIAVLCFTFFSYYQLRKSAGIRRANLFEVYANQASEKLSKRIVDYTQILRGCQSLFYSSDSVTAKEWELYSVNLHLAENYPGIQGIGYAKYIKRSEIPMVENFIRTDFSSFKIKSNSINDHLTPIIYLEPKDHRNMRAFGFDMFSEKNRREAMERAMLSGDAAMTKKVKLIQETEVDVQPGFLLYLPIYANHKTSLTPADRKNNILGFVYIPFRAYDLMNAILKGFSDIGIEVYDQNQAIQDNLIYKGGANFPHFKRNINGNWEFTSNHILNIAGNKWLVKCYADYQFGSPIERQQPQIVLIFGMAISILLYLLTINYINKRQAALDELNIAKEIERKKDEFIGIASHELKTPLTSIKAYLQMLGRANLGEKERHFVSKANRQTTKLSSLIADLLDVSKIQAGSLKLNYAPFLLSDLINESIESVLHMYQSHTINRPENIEAVSLMGDKLRLEQALINLLVNAIKYSPGSKTIDISLSISGNKVIINVTDYGIGISKENQSRIFEKFYRAEELSPIFSGLGMGLFIACEIVKRHRGDIKVQSQINGGSTFSIIVPVGKANVN